MQQLPPSLPDPLSLFDAPPRACPPYLFFRLLLAVTHLLVRNTEVQVGVGGVFAPDGAPGFIRDALDLGQKARGLRTLCSDPSQAEMLGTSAHRVPFQHTWRISLPFPPPHPQ